MPHYLTINLFFLRSAYTKEEYILAGEHGWNNLNSEMKALFVAQGPSFQKKLEVRPFHNIDLYNLMCAMIGIEPSPNNGTWVHLHFIFSIQFSIAFKVNSIT